ncbi:DoxX family membrane protein [Streptomyces sp. NPDC008122]|uniref:DoxX family protein n=1 Tax=Streptomyces sp. NPDC008122 TaxID=3364810 RepID=UPI0036E69E5A
MTGQTDRPHDRDDDPTGPGPAGNGGRFVERKATFDVWRATASRYALLPLRIFLGVTFVYAGLDKLTDSAFFADTGSGSIGEMMRGVRDGSAIPALVDLALNNPTGFGYAIAFGELAVGLGTLFGLFARLAALGGALISLSLWLTVSWQVHPYYLGNDLIYLMSWLPLLLAGAPVLSLDRLLAERRRIR